MVSGDVKSACIAFRRLWVGFCLGWKGKIATTRSSFNCLISVFYQFSGIVIRIYWTLLWLDFYSIIFYSFSLIFEMELWKYLLPLLCVFTMYVWICAWQCALRSKDSFVASVLFFLLYMGFMENSDPQTFAGSMFAC